MDSMRSLNTSLPRSSKRCRSPHPPEQLAQAFKDAALYVTKLYRTAELSGRLGTQNGYQDALDDLLAFLDQENIGLCDGEGWRIRQWATERLDGRSFSQDGSESEDEKAEGSKAKRTKSPPNQRRSIPRKQKSASPSSEALSSPIDQPPICSLERRVVPSSLPEIFTFRSAHPFPQDIDMQPPGSTDFVLPSTESQMHTQPASTVKVNVLSRNGKPRSNRQPSRPSTTRGLGPGAGSKRRIPFGEYFDLATMEGVKRGKLG